MPRAARITDFHTCPKVEPGPVSHVGGPVSSGSPNVIVGHLPACRVGDTAVCVPAIDSVNEGSSNVFINHRAASRIGDSTAHGGVIVAGCATVNIGDTAQVRALISASQSAAPFCEACERARRQKGELRAPASHETPPQSVTREPERPPVEPDRMALATGIVPADPELPLRMAARESLAWDHFERQTPPLSPPEIEARVRSLDLTRPVEIVDGVLQATELAR